MRPLHELSTEEIVADLRHADRQALAAVEAASGLLAAAIDAVVTGWRAGGRLIYVGAGTSGRIGVLDAAECPPTFGVAPGRVVAILAGGPEALVQAVEAAEDDEGEGRAALAALEPAAADVVVGLSASGTTPFTCAALEEAAARGATTVAVTGSAASRLAAAAAIPVVVEVGDEPVRGSTRMKAGTAQKLVCNTLTTGAFARLGRVWDRHMVGVRTHSDKLRRRAVGILEAVTGGDAEAAARTLEAAGGDLPTAVVMARGGVDHEAAARHLAATGGDVPAAVARAGQRRS